MTKMPNLPEDLQLGATGLRAIAALFDMVVAGFLCYPFFPYWGRYNDAEQSYQVTGLPAIGLMLTVFSYWVVTDWSLGGSIGKLICDLRVVSVSGKKCSIKRSIKRNVLRPVDFFPFYLTAFIAVKLSPLRQRLGDQWAKTVVVKRAKKPSMVASVESPPFS